MPSGCSTSSKYFRDVPYFQLGIIGYLLVSNQEWSPFGKEQTRAVLLCTSVLKLWLLPTLIESSTSSLFVNKEMRDSAAYCVLSSLEKGGA